MNLKNLLFLNNIFIKNRKRFLLLPVLFIFITTKSQNIANYINNGGFEQHHNCLVPSLNSVKYWRNIDSINGAGPYYANTCFPNVPTNSFGYQWPHSGSAYGMGSVLCQTPQCSPTVNRLYFRNRLKGNLVTNKTYCVKLYVNVSNAATYGISNIGLFFVDNSIDTITKSNIPLTYIIPQIANPTSNILTDTMNWVAITGTFVANGTEKNCVIGNFKSDAATTKTLINPTNLPTIGCDILIDDVSCIPLDLPAYAAPGNDIWAIPGNTIYLGRPQDVGIDEACEWFKLPNTTSVIANAAGLTLTVAITTNTYMVKQTICGIVNYDTVVVHASGVGLSEQEIIKNSVYVFPNPATDKLNITLNFDLEKEFTKIEILNSLGQLIREEEIVFKNKTATIKTVDLPNGVYLLNLKGNNSFGVVKRFTVAK